MSRTSKETANLQVGHGKFHFPMSLNFPLRHRAEVLVILVLVLGGNDNVIEVSARTFRVSTSTSKMWYEVPRMRPLPQATWPYDGEGLMEAETPTRSDEGDAGPANDYEMPSPSGDAGEENANPPYILSPSSIDELTAESTPPLFPSELRSQDIRAHSLLCHENDEGLIDGAGLETFIMLF